MTSVLAQHYWAAKWQQSCSFVPCHPSECVCLQTEGGLRTLGPAAIPAGAAAGWAMGSETLRVQPHAHVNLASHGCFASLCCRCRCASRGGGFTFRGSFHAGLTANGLSGERGTAQATQPGAQATQKGAHGRRPCRLLQSAPAGHRVAVGAAGPCRASWSALQQANCPRRLLTRGVAADPIGAAVPGSAATRLAAVGPGAAAGHRLADGPTGAGVADGRGKGVVALPAQPSRTTLGVDRWEEECTHVLSCTPPGTTGC